MSTPIATPAPTLPTRVLRMLDRADGEDDGWLLALRAWVLNARSEEAANERLALLVEHLRGDDESRGRSRAAVATLYGDASAISFLSEAGLPTRPGFAAEALDRLVRRILPRAPESRDLGAMLARLLPDGRSADAAATLDVATLGDLLSLVGDPQRRAAGELQEAIEILQIRIGALGLEAEVAHRLAEAGRDPSIFRAIASRDAGRTQLAACREALDALAGTLEGSGVSVALVYRLEQLDRALARLEELFDLRDAPSLQKGRAFVAETVRLAERESGVRALAQRNLRLLARRITEHSGETGSHYITETRGQWREMLLRAAGGGVLTAGTAAAKYLGAGLALALLPDAMLAVVIYAGSFLLMQALGLTLATKQPSMTAAALAAALRDQRKGRLLEIIQRITRSQAAAALGNLGAVIPATLALQIGYGAFFGGPILSQEKARAVIDSLRPFASGTIFFAALTGVLLWASSVIAGALHNWAVVRRLPEGIAHSPRVRAFFGARGARWLGEGIRTGMAGIAGNTSLGVLLAMTPFAGKLLGLPLDVRHVTLSTGALTMAVFSLGPEALFSLATLGAVFGIAIIASLNFGVSFALALWVAIRAQGVEEQRGKGLWRVLAARLLRQPGTFLRPPPA